MLVAFGELGHLKFVSLFGELIEYHAIFTMLITMCECLWYIMQIVIWERITVLDQYVYSSLFSCLEGIEGQSTLDGPIEEIAQVEAREAEILLSDLGITVCSTVTKY